MKIHEFQAKEVLARHGVPVPRGLVATTPDEAVARAAALETPVVVLKAQIHAGGRGKAGGVKVVRDLGRVHAEAATILGWTLVTKQTGPAGRLVRRILVEEGTRIQRELYLGMVLDRARERPVVMASTEGGVEIEEVAARSPEKILKEWVDPVAGLDPFLARRIVFRLGLSGETAQAAARLVDGVGRAFFASDASMVEVNPLVITESGGCVALDAKITLDDNALFRHKDLEAYRDLDEEEPTETRAADAGLSYVKMDGEIGCLVNGAGLAMSTMDVIKIHGGSPANFLDVGGGATAEQVTEAMSIILEDPHVRAILINIFGGIMKCDVIAEGVIQAARAVSLRVPLVVRLEGTRVEEGRRMLAESGLPIVSATDMADAARKVVAAARGGTTALSSPRDVRGGGAR